MYTLFQIYGNVLRFYKRFGSENNNLTAVEASKDKAMEISELQKGKINRIYFVMFTVEPCLSFLL